MLPPNVRWVHALLKPYLDRCLRVQTMVAAFACSANDRFSASGSSGNKDRRGVFNDATWNLRR